MKKSEYFQILDRRRRDILQILDNHIELYNSKLAKHPEKTEVYMMIIMAYKECKIIVDEALR